MLLCIWNHMAGWLKETEPVSEKTLLSVYSYINLLKLNISCQRLGFEHWFAVACVSEAWPRSQWSELLRRSIIDDEIWQAVEPYGPFFLLQLLVFPQLICADQVVCVCVCVCSCLRPYVTSFAHEHYTSNFPYFNMSDMVEDSNCTGFLLYSSSIGERVVLWGDSVHSRCLYHRGEMSH